VFGGGGTARREKSDEGKNEFQSGRVNQRVHKRKTCEKNDNA